MTRHDFAPPGANPILTALRVARIPVEGVAAPFPSSGDCKEKWT
jgi:hypothetical protein